MVYLERVDNDLESLANSGEAWKGRKMPGEMKQFQKLISTIYDAELTYPEHVTQR